MAHELPALTDDNTFVGYNFVTQTYYIKNMDTETVAQTPEEAKIIFDITAPYNNITVDQIRQLSIDLEPITEIHYTWEDNGKYIKSIYFNDYKDHSIIYEEPNLYVQGSNEMWDMSSAIGKKTIRDFFWSYFMQHLGLEISTKMIDNILDYYVSVQSPYVYNNILPKKEDEEEEELKYSNVLTLNNPDGSSRGVYTATKNPEEVYITEVYDVVKWGTATSTLKHVIDSMNILEDSLSMRELLQDENAVTLTGGGKFGVGSKFEVFGTPANDGIYTVARLERYQGPNVGDKPITKIHVEGQIKSYYSATLGTQAYIKIIDEPVVSYHEDSFTIKGVPHLQIGDLLQVRGADNISNKTVKRIDDNGYDANNEHTYRILLNETLDGDSNKTGNKVYAQAWKVTQIGCSDYTRVTGSMGISKICDVNSQRRIYIAGAVKSTDFVTSGSNQTKIWLNYGNDTIKGPYSVIAVKPTIPDPNVESETELEDLDRGYIRVSTNPSLYTYSIGSTPLCLETHENYRVDENSITLEAYHIENNNGTTFDKIPSVSSDDVIEIKNSGEWDNSYTVDKIEKHHNYASGKYLYKIWLKDIEEPLKHYNGTTAILQPRIYSERILMDMTYSRRADKIPTGKFMFDDNQQLTKYLETYYVTPPTSNNYGNINQPVDPTYYLGDNLMLTTKAVEGSIIVTDRAGLESIRRPAEGTIAYIKSGYSVAPYYDRYRYTDSEWLQYPEPTYMICDGLYSENYESE